MANDSKHDLTAACDHVWEDCKTNGYWCHYEYQRCQRCGEVRDVTEFDAAGYEVGPASSAVQRSLVSGMKK